MSELYWDYVCGGVYTEPSNIRCPILEGFDDFTQIEVWGWKDDGLEKCLGFSYTIDNLNAPYERNKLFEDYKVPGSCYLKRMTVPKNIYKSLLEQYTRC